MPKPKSVTKIKAKKGKVGITYMDFSDQANYYLFELSRTALTDVGKFVQKLFSNVYYQHFKKHTGDAGKVTSHKVYSNANTLYPRVSVGLKVGRVDGFYAYFQEFGTSKQKRLGLLSNAVKSNIAEIVKIESQYLSGLSGEAERLDQLINEDEIDG